MAQTRGPNQVHADGTITVVCRVCGEPIDRMRYQGFSTAICHRCYTGVAVPKPPDEIQVMDLYNTEDEGQRPKGRMVRDLVQQVFRAVGFAKKPKIPVPSEEVAQSKKRRSLLSDLEGEKINEDR